MGEGFHELGISFGFNFICPKCKGNDVIVEEVRGFYKFYKCNSCSFVK